MEGVLRWVLGTAECSGMTPINQVPAAGGDAAAAAQAAAQAAAAAAAGQAIGTNSGMSPQEQMAAEQAKQAQLGLAPGAGSEKKRGNPGNYDHADGEATQVLNPDVHDGFRAAITRTHGQRFQTSHEFLFGTKMVQEGSQYHFGATAAPSDGFLLRSRLSHAGQVFSELRKELAPGLLGALTMQLTPDAGQRYGNAELEYQGSDFTSVLKMSQGPYVGFNYFQSVTKNLALGGEAQYHHSQGVSLIAARARYDDGKRMVCGTLSSKNSLSLKFLKKVSPRFMLASEIEADLNSNKSVANAGWVVTTRQARVSGTLSTEGVVLAQLTQQVDPITAVSFNAVLDFAQDKQRFGFGINLMLPQ